jgi:hypothetical protein
MMRALWHHDQLLLASTRLETWKVTVSSNPRAQLSARPNDNASGQSRLAAEHDMPLQVRRDNSQ